MAMGAAGTHPRSSENAGVDPITKLGELRGSAIMEPDTVAFERIREIFRACQAPAQ
jgi:hypothetical protein